mmetsp:Transcript_84158/g.176091  ORF Transcript_84158/g.176091 Transcript_84158/m.176091 type:complete len:695 (-) Transcript_84158:1704-3788(-)
MAPPPEKKAKTDADEKPAEGETKEKEKEKEEEPELEGDCGTIKANHKITERIRFLAQTSTLNVLASDNGMLMSLGEGSIQNLLAGARANAGITKGRYFYEVKVLEVLHHSVANNRAVLRMGFSTVNSSLMLGTTTESICFDIEGAWIFNNLRTALSQRVPRESTIGVLLNLDPSMKNNGTISFFKDGVRVSSPIPLPADLKGKALYPHVCYKGYSVFVNFGPSPLVPLPFKCHMIQGCSKSHVEIAAEIEQGEEKGEVLFPVSLPDEGSFDWLDLYKEEHPGYFEISDRVLTDWAQKSGLFGRQGKASNDRYGHLQEMDDLRKSVYQAAQMQKRDYIIMEVRNNLIAEERKKMLEMFDDSMFTRKAIVLVGEPTDEYKEKSQELILRYKQEASDHAFLTKKAEEKKNKMVQKAWRNQAKKEKKLKKEAEIRRKQMVAEAKKKARETRIKTLEEAKSNGTIPEEEIAKQLKQLQAEGEAEEKELATTAQAEGGEDSEMEDETQQDDDDDKEEPPKVTLTEEEKKLWFAQHSVKDLTMAMLSSSFSSFSLPTEDESFDDIDYEWAGSDDGPEYLKKWIRAKKSTLRVDDLTPGTWSQKTYNDFQESFRTWQGAYKNYRDEIARKEKAKIEKVMQKKRAAMLKEAEKARAEVLKKVEASEEKDEEDGDEKMEDVKKEEAEVKEEEPEKEEEEEQEAK